MKVFLQHIDKLVLGVALVALLASLGMFIHGMNAANQRVDTIRNEAFELPAGKIPPVTQDQFRAPQLLTTPALRWAAPDTKTQNSMFAPRRYIFCADADCPYILPYNAKVCPQCKTPQGAEDELRPIEEGQDEDGDKLPRTYEERYSFLDDRVASDAERDFDNDLFSNFEEYKANTDPADAGSHPPLVEKIRFLRFQKQRLPLMLYQIKTYGHKDKKRWDLFITLGKDRRNRTKIYSVGETLIDDRYTIVDAAHSTRQVMDPTINITRTVEDSTVTLHSNTDETVIKLEKGKRPLSTNLYVTFVLLTDPADFSECRRFRVKVGQVVPLRDMAGNVERYEAGFLSSRNTPTLQPLGADGEPLGEPVPVPRFSPNRDLKRPEESATMMNPGDEGEQFLNPNREEQPPFEF